MNKKWLVAGLIVVLLVLVGLAVVLQRRQKIKPIETVSQARKISQMKVVAWDKNSAELKYTDDGGVEQKLVVVPLRPGVIVNKNDPKKPSDTCCLQKFGA